jgi:hypothetical protein
MSMQARDEEGDKMGGFPLVYLMRSNLRDQQYNHIHPHSSLGCRPPAPEAVEPRLPSRGFLSEGGMVAALA